MTKAQKQQLRQDRSTMSALDVARKWGITRQRVHQIVKEDPDKASREYERPLPTEASSFVRFAHKRLKHLNDAALQHTIAHTPGSNLELAGLFKATPHAIQRIRHILLGARKSGGRPNKYASAEERQIAINRRQRERRARDPEKHREYYRNYKKRDPERTKQRQAATYQRRKEKHAEYYRNYYRANRLEIRARNAEWRARNPEKDREIRRRAAAKYRAKRANLTASAGGMG